MFTRSISSSRAAMGCTVSPKIHVEAPVPQNAMYLEMEP